MENISDKLREVLADLDEPLRETARNASIDASQLSRFLSDTQPGGKLSQDSIDRLAAYLGLELRPIPKSRRKG